MHKRIVTGLWVYPVKSLGGIELQSAKVFPKGLEHDRRWMLIGADNGCMTQRDYPLMALFTTSFHDDGILINYDGVQHVVPLQSKADPISAIVWNDTVDVHEVSPQLSEWFSEILQTSCRLVAFPENNPRRVDPGHSVHADHVSLADAYPLLIIGQRSLDDLNSRMQSPLPMNRFRPNVVFDGGEAFEEDGWHQFTIGRNRFAAVKLCSRCVLTTVDQHRGVKTGPEPLATLASYRKKDNHIYFGQNLIPIDHREIAVGDEITF
jgi:uncharacterized protein YcbX